MHLLELWGNTCFAEREKMFFFYCWITIKRAWLVFFEWISLKSKPYSGKGICIFMMQQLWNVHTCINTFKIMFGWANKQGIERHFTSHPKQRIPASHMEEAPRGEAAGVLLTTEPVLMFVCFMAFSAAGEGQQDCWNDHCLPFALPGEHCQLLVH